MLLTMTLSLSKGHMGKLTLKNQLISFATRYADMTITNPATAENMVAWAFFTPSGLSPLVIYMNDPVISIMRKMRPAPTVIKGITMFRIDPKEEILATGLFSGFEKSIAYTFILLLYINYSFLSSTGESDLI